MLATLSRSARTIGLFAVIVVAAAGAVYVAAYVLVFALSLASLPMVVAFMLMGDRAPSLFLYGLALIPVAGGSLALLDWWQSRRRRLGPQRWKE